MIFTFNFPAPIFTISDLNTKVLFAILILIVCYIGIGFILPHFILKHTDRRQVHIAIILYIISDLLAMFISVTTGAILVGAIATPGALLLICILAIQTVIDVASSEASYENHDV